MTTMRDTGRVWPGVVAAGRAPRASDARLPRRAVLAGAAALALPAVARAQEAGAYPSRPVRVIVGFAAGGLADITIRLVGEALSPRLGQQVVVDNRPGAGGTLAATAAAAAPPDGHTLTILSTGNAIARTLFRSLPYDPVADFAAVSTLVTFDLLLLVASGSPVRSVADLAALGRRGPLAIGTIAPGSTQNLTGQWLRVAAAPDATVVPYRSTPEVLTAVQRGDVAVGVESFAAVRSMLEGGQLRAVGSTGEARSSLLPKVPTLREGGLDVAVVGWNALFAPARTPRPIIEVLNRQVNEVLAMPSVRERITGLGVEVAAGPPEAMAELLRRDVATWASVIERAGIERQ